MPTGKPLLMQSRAHEACAGPRYKSKSSLASRVFIQFAVGSSHSVGAKAGFLRAQFATAQSPAESPAHRQSVYKKNPRCNTIRVGHGNFRRSRQACEAM